MVESAAIQQAIDFLNKEFFGGRLPDVFVRYETRAKSDGYYKPSEYSARDGKYEKDSIALNSNRFARKSDLQILADLQHLLCHHADYYAGTAPARHYHSEQWSDMMVAAGVMPSSTGGAGGKRTGKMMSQFVIVGGRFEQAYAKLAATGWRLNLQSTPAPGPKVKNEKNKTTLKCPCCNDLAYTNKPGKRWVCPECGYLAIPRDADPSEIKRYQLIEIENAAGASYGRQAEADAPYERKEPASSELNATARDAQADVDWMRDTVSAGDYRFDQRSSDWVGVPLMERLGLPDNRGSRKRAAALLDAWFESGALTAEVARTLADTIASSLSLETSRSPMFVRTSDRHLSRSVSAAGRKVRRTSKPESAASGERGCA